MQVRLMKIEFAVHPKSGYISLEDLWDGEVSCESSLNEVAETGDYSDFLRCFS
jgi:alcohol dehydrogenase (NADP+)